MDRTRAAYLISKGLAGDEAEQVEGISQSYPGSDFGEVNARHGCDPQDRSRLMMLYECTSIRVWGGVGDREEERVIGSVDMII